MYIYIKKRGKDNKYKKVAEAINAPTQFFSGKGKS